jgi:alkylated DNA repair dioxygenase AlkB
MAQLSLFDKLPGLPAGFQYQPALLAAAEEETLVQEFATLPFKDFEFHGFVGKRRIVSFGWQYDFANRALRKTEPMPAFLHPIREKAARFAGLPAAGFQQALVTEYAPGATIGWHRDRPVFGEVIGVSLLSPCVFRLRRKTGTTWQRASLTVEPRSVYLLQGAARSEWEHSIPALDTLRYSITFRNFKDG